jgi:hypothetical protein
MSKKELTVKEPKAPKVPKTIKVKTVIVSIIIVLALVGSFIGGIVYEKNDQVRVNKQAAKLIKSLK